MKPNFTLHALEAARPFGTFWIATVELVCPARFLGRNHTFLMRLRIARNPHQVLEYERPEWIPPPIRGKDAFGMTKEAIAAIGELIQRVDRLLQPVAI